MEYLLKVCALLTVFYVVYQFLLQKETFFKINRAFLLVGLLVSFLLPLCTIPVYHEYVPQTFPVETYQEFTEVTIPTTPLVIEQSFDIKDYLPYVYVFGIVVFLSLFVFRLISLLRACVKTKGYKNESFTMLETFYDVTPFSFFKWIVFNPNQFQNEEFEQIIAHEKAHAKQYHSIDILIMELCCVLLWFHPLVWLYNKNLKQNLEFLADKYAINQVKNRKSYQYTLLKALVHSNTMALSNQFYNSLIKKRIAMLQKSQSKKINLLKYLLVLPALGYFLMSFNTKDVFVEKNLNEVRIVVDKYTSDKELKEYKDFFKNEYGAEFIYNKLKRNSEEEIIAIELKLINQHKARAITTRQLENKPIDAFSIFYNPKEQVIEVFRFVENKFILHDYFSDSKLKFFVKELKEQGFDFELKKIRRNKEGLIKTISFTINKDGVKGNYEMKSPNSIAPILIEFKNELFHINTLEFAELEEKRVNGKAFIEFVIDKNTTIADLEKVKSSIEKHSDVGFNFKILKKGISGIQELEYEFTGNGKTHRETINTQSKSLFKFNPKTNLLSTSNVDKNGAVTYGNVEMLCSKHTVRITKKESDENLKILVKKLKEKGVFAAFSNVKRNSLGEICSIEVKAKSKFSEEKMLAISVHNFPINDILISHEGNGYNLKVYVKDINQNDAKIKEAELENKNQQREAKRLELNDDKQKEKSIKYIIDEKEVSESEFKNTQPDEIESIYVYKGKAISENSRKKEIESVLIIIKKEKEDEFKLLLTKNITDEELAKHKKRYKTKFGKELTYKVERNSTKEIVLFEMVFFGGNSIKTDKKESKGLPIQPMLIKNDVNKNKLIFHHIEL